MSHGFTDEYAAPEVLAGQRTSTASDMTVRVVPNPRFGDRPHTPEIHEELRRGVGEVRNMFHAPMPQRQRRGSDASDASEVHSANHSQASVTTSEALADTEPSDDAIHAVPAAASCACSGP